MKFINWNIIVSLSILFLFSCEQAEDDLTSTASLSFAVPASGALLKPSNSDVQLDSVKILLKTIQFHSEDEGDSLDFKTEPQILNLALDGSVNTLHAADIPLGTYNKVSFRIHKPEDDEDPGDPDFKEGTSGNERFCVVIDGTYEGTAFTFKSRRSTKQRVDIDPPLVIDEEGLEVNVTLTVDVNSWFMDEDGNPLNPLEEGDEDEIDDAIRRSFRGFRDDDRQGNHP